MTDTDDLYKAVGDFLKGKAGPPDARMATLTWEGEGPISLPAPKPLSATFSELAAEYPVLVSHLAKSKLDEVVALVGGLQTLPELQSNTLRLQVLAHLAVMLCKGRQRPTPATLAAWFNQLDKGTCGRMEDPAEDLFITNVSDGNGNYRIFEGTAEGNAFYTQLFIDVVDSVPSVGLYAQLQRAVRALLVLSDAIVARAGLPRNLVGRSTPLARISKPDNEAFRELKRVTVFSPDDITALGIEAGDLNPFIFDERSIDYIGAASIEHTPLRHQPLIQTGDAIRVALPGSIGIAIRCYIIECCLSAGLAKSLEKAVARMYSDLLSDEILLRNLPLAPIELSDHGSHCGANVCLEIDEGRHLHLCLFSDIFQGYEKGGIAGVNQIEPVTAFIEKSIGATQARLTKDPRFREAVTLVIGCGWGRSLGHLLPECPPNWWVTSLPVHDLITLSRVPDFSALDIYRIRDAVYAVETQRFSLVNQSGLLNLYAWMDESGGHIVPHEQLEASAIEDGRTTLFRIPSNSNLKLRADVAMQVDLHRAYSPEGSMRLVRRALGGSGDGAEHLSPFYVDLEALKGKK